MLTCFVERSNKRSVPIKLILQNQFEPWLKKTNAFTKRWLTETEFKPEPGSFRMIPNSSGGLDYVVCILNTTEHLWDVGTLPLNLPQGVYHFDEKNILLNHFAVAWGLGAYQFNRYKLPKRQPAKLVLSKAIDKGWVTNLVESIYFVRDLINTPTDDMGPSEFSAIALHLSKQFNAKLIEIVGEDLLKNNFSSIYTVGRASDDSPRLLDLRWGNKKHPKVTLVGKGVCFDSGGLDIKSASNMLLMKKDMAGGAHVLGLARLIMQTALPVCLRVLIPVVENVISGNAYRPGDIIKSRQGLTIEIGNTDAEGRVILADALTEAVSENPELLIDITTLTGAARIALGTDLPALFTNQDELAYEVMNQSQTVHDPIWRLPLFDLYRDTLNTPFADINNTSTNIYGGAITAALFLKAFVPDHIPWIHLDMMAWNLKSRPGRPEGGEAMALRGLFNYLVKKFGSN